MPGVAALVLATVAVPRCCVVQMSAMFSRMEGVHAGYQDSGLVCDPVVGWDEIMQINAQVVCYALYAAVGWVDLWVCGVWWYEWCGVVVAWWWWCVGG